jgi:hypothetical protein
MHDFQRYRCNVADCLPTARKSPEPRYQKRYLLLALSWLSHQDDTTDELLASSWGIAESIDADGCVLPFSPRGAVEGYERFIKLAPQSAFTCSAITQSQATHAGA